MSSPKPASSSPHAEDFEYSPPAYFDASSQVPGWLQTACVYGFSFVTIHYFFWPIPFLLAFYWMYQHGYGLVVVALLTIYLPSLLDGAEKTGSGRVWDRVRLAHAWRLSTKYLGLKVIRQQELDSSKKYVFAYHPHGIIILSRVATYGGTWEKLFPKIPTRVLGASTMFYIPLARELCLWLGAVNASRSTADKVLQAGSSVTVYPGGVPEIFMVEPKSTVNKILLKKRLGFVKLAIRHGAELVPVFVFGEKWLYSQWNPPRFVIHFFQKVLKMPLIVFWGKFMWIPHQMPKGKDFGVVYGKPIPVKQNDHPTHSEVEELHAKYMSAVERLFEDYKAKFGYDEAERLEIV